MEPVRVLVADHFAIRRLGYREVLKQLPEVVVVGEASNGRMALRVAQKLLPDVILLEHELPGLNALELLRRLRACGVTSRVLVFGRSTRPADAEALLRAGAAGYMHDYDELDLTLAAIRGVARGETGWLSPRLAGKPA